MAQDEMELVEKLINLFQKNKSLRDRFLEAIGANEFFRRDELGEILAELHNLYVQNTNMIEAFQRRMDLIQAQIDEGFATMDKRFEESNRRFEAMQKQIDEHIEDSKRRFDAMQKQMDERFAESDKRFEAMQKQMDERFEESKRRFDAMQKQMDERFAESDKRFEAMQKQMDERFAASDERFEELLENLDKRFMEIRKDLTVMQATIEDISGKYGHRMEDAARKLLDEVLQEEGIDPGRIQHIQIIDKTGEIFAKNYTTDIDIYYKGQKVWVIEYKARADRGDVIHFIQTIRLLRTQYQIDPDKIILVVLSIADNARALAQDLGVEVIQGVSSPPIFYDSGEGLIGPSD